MEIKRNLKIFAEMGVGLTAVAALMLVGCGGGGGGTKASVATTTTKVIPFKGKFTSGKVTLLDASGDTVQLLNGSGSIDASGVASVTFDSSVKYPLIVEVAGTYYNEVTGASESSATPIRSIITDPNVATYPDGVGVTAITEIAVAGLEHKLGGFSQNDPISAASAVTEIDGAESLIGKNHSTMTVPVFDAGGHTNDPDTLRLAALSIVASNGAAPGNTLADDVRDLARTFALNQASAPTAIITQGELDAALAAVNGGKSSIDISGSVSETFTLPASSIAATEAANHH
jgi:hypothetical protein